MNLMLLLLMPAIVVALLAAPLIPVYRGTVNKTMVKKRCVTNLCLFAGLCLCGVLLPIGGLVSAAGAEGAALSVIGTSAQGMGFLAAALSTGLSAVGAGIAVAAAAPAAIGAVSEDPKAFGKAMIFVVLGEGIAIYGLLISILIITKI